jgi:hypothetical protein
MSRDGGAAFPSPGVVLGVGGNMHQQGAYEGMTLRDYFAAAASQGLLTKLLLESNVDDFPDKHAMACYAIADAMLMERAK